MTADWPTEARETLREIIGRRYGYVIGSDLDEILAALAPHVQPRTDDWDWGHRPRVGSGLATNDGGVIESRNEGHARAMDHGSCDIVRRRPAGEWEVAP